jgi:hypothetical protein
MLAYSCDHIIVGLSRQAVSSNKVVIWFVPAMTSLEHSLGLGWNAATVGWVRYFTIYITLSNYIIDCLCNGKN